MYHRLYASKYRQEIISLVWDFLDQLTPGDPISSVLLVDVIVSSGTDANPLDMVFGSPSLSGSVVSQHIRRGIPGTIYTITITVETVSGDIFEDVCYLAILPRLEDLNVVIWETTQLYSLDAADSMQGLQTLHAGLLKLEVYPIPPEGIQGVQVPQSGNLLAQNYVNYAIPPEFIQGLQVLFSGSLIGQSYITYNIPPENIQGSQILLSGELILEVIIYNIPHEDIQGSQILTSGTLT